MARCRLPSTVRFRYRRCRLMLTLLFAKLGLLITAGAGAAVSGKKWLLSEITVAPRSEVNASTENARLPPRGVLGGSRRRVFDRRRDGAVISCKLDQDGLKAGDVGLATSAPDL